MTSPSPFGPSQDDYVTRANWLGRYLDVENDAIKRLSDVLSDAADSIDDTFKRLIKPANFSQQVRKSQLALVHSAIRSKVKEVFGDSKDIIRSGQQDAAVAAVNAQLYDEKSILSQMFGTQTDRSQYADSLKQTARRNIDAVMTRVLETEQPFSQRVYHSQAIATGQVNQIVNRALAKGDSAADLAKAVKDSIKPEVPGGVSYAAKRLARTEINNAFHAQSIHDMQSSPWTDSVEWNLSKTHAETGCLCEQYARQKIFPKENVPAKPHPNCRCYVTAKQVDYDTFENSLVAGHYDSYLDSLIPKPAGDIGSSYSISTPDIKPETPQHVSWNGPKIAEPIKDTYAEVMKTDAIPSDLDIANSAVIDDIDQVWTSTEFDEFKGPIRQGARIAQREGYSGMPKKVRSEVAALQEDTSFVSGPDPEDRSDELLQMYGKEILARAVHDPNTTQDLFRGLQIESDELDKFVEGQHISMPLSSFSDDPFFAQGFAQGENWLSADAEALESPVGILFELTPGAKAAEMSGGEHVTFGQFKVTNVRDDHQMGLVRIELQHVSMKEAAVEDAKTTAGAYSKGGDNDIPEFEFVEPPPIGTGKPRPAAQLKRNQNALSKVREVVPNARVVGFDDPGLDPKASTSFAKTIVSLSKAYPDAAASIDSIGFSDIERSGAYGVTYKGDPNRRTGGFRSRGMVLRIDYAQDVNHPDRGFQTKIERDVSKKFHPPIAAKDGVAQTVTHEFAHVMMNMIEGTPSEITADDALNYLGRKYKSIGEPNGKSKKGWGDWVNEQLSGYSFETDSKGNAVRDFLGEKYGATTFNFSEAIPEAFSAVHLGQANEAERALYELLIDSYHDALEIQ